MREAVAFKSQHSPCEGTAIKAAAVRGVGRNQFPMGTREKGVCVPVVELSALNDVL